MKKRRRARIELSTQHRRNEVATLLAAGVLNTEVVIKPLSEKLSDPSQKALELSPKTRLSVSTESK